MKSPAVFLDRDGTLVHPRHYPSRPEELILYEGIGPALRALQGAGFRLVVITNQAGIARGYFTTGDLDRMHDHLRRELAGDGVHLDGIYYCPHHVEGVIPELAVPCGCRKPRAGLLLRAARDLDLDLAGSWMIGDILDDMEAGKRAGCRTILVDLGTETLPAAFPRQPDIVAPDTLRALRIIRETSTRHTPVDIVHGFRHRRALVIGDAMLDTYLEGTAARLCREGPVPVVHKSGEEHIPGGAANVAANLRALGAEVTLLAIIGRDPAGALLRTALRRRGVDDGSLVEDPGTATLHKLRILADEQYVVRFDAGEACRPAGDVRRRLLAALDDALARSDLVVISDYGYGAVPDAALERLRDWRRRHPCVLVVDAKDLNRYRDVGATLVTPNHVEARRAVDPAAPSAGRPLVPDVERIGRQLLARIDAERAAITMAGAGALLVDRESAIHLPAHPVARASDVGAGDTFASAAALALAGGATPEEATRIGIEAAGIAVTKERTAVVRQQELLQRISLHAAPLPPDVEVLAARLREEQSRGRAIVLTNGVFDILHAGHVAFLREARRLGDVLVVAVNSDESARRLKGEHRPINSARDRMALVGALDPVDHVIPFDEETPETLIHLLRPDVHVKGGDYAGEDLPEAGAVRENGGRVVILPLFESVSTSTMIDRIVRLLA